MKNNEMNSRQNNYIRICVGSVEGLTDFSRVERYYRMSGRTSWGQGEAEATDII